LNPVAASTNALESIFQASRTPADYVSGFLSRLAELLGRVDAAAVAKFIETIERARDENREIFFIGNGGSAAVASHIVNDLAANALTPGKPGFRAFCLADNVESVTAIANDVGYEHVFEHQLKCVLQEGDVVVALSVSGNSPNIIRAIDYANSKGAVTIGLSGFDGGKLARKCAVSIRVESTRDEYGPVEDIFSNLGHVLTGYLTMKQGKKLSH
jgi:D-sedoheptulose 7-phosphate isomerase